jgi:serine/threonine protein kinase
MNIGEKIGPYILERQLGRGVTASTWLARHAEESEGEKSAARAPREAGRGKGTVEAPAGDVVLKILDLKETSSWNAVDVFKREAKALEVLSHPGIPAYKGSFETELDSSIKLVLAMEHIRGDNLERLVASGKKYDEAEVERILACLADILAYLGSLRPPVVHRDVNPRNIILRPDSSLALVDFSGAQDAVRSALYPGATLVGTAGYIPLEQGAGKASHRSDLYGAAATAVFLLTGRNPAELPSRGLRTDLSGLVELSPRLKIVLDSWLSPDVADRGLSAAVAAAILRGENYSATPSPEPEPRHREVEPETDTPHPKSLPMGSKLAVDESEGRLSISFPSLGLGAAGLRGIPFVVFWIGFVGFWTLMVFRMRAPLFFPAFSLPFWAVGFIMAKTIFGPMLTKKKLVLGPEGLLVRSEILGIERNVLWPLDEIGALRIAPAKVQYSHNLAKELVIETGTKQLHIGMGLSERELRFLEKRLKDTIKEIRARSGT